MTSLGWFRCSGYDHTIHHDSEGESRTAGLVTLRTLSDSTYEVRRVRFFAATRARAVGAFFQRRL